MFYSRLTFCLATRPDAAHTELSVPRPHAGTAHAELSVPRPHAGTAHAELSVPKSNAGTAHTELSVPKSHAGTAHAELSIPKSNAVTAHTELSVPKSHAGTAHTELSVPKSHARTAHAELSVPKSHAGTKQVSRCICVCAVDQTASFSYVSQKGGFFGGLIYQTDEHICCMKQSFCLFVPRDKPFYLLRQTVELSVCCAKQMNLFIILPVAPKGWTFLSIVPNRGMFLLH